MNKITAFNWNNVFQVQNFIFMKELRFYVVLVIGLGLFFGLNKLLYIESTLFGIKNQFYYKTFISSIFFSAQFSIVFYLFRAKCKSLEAFIYAVLFVSISSLFILFLFYLNTTVGLIVTVSLKLTLLSVFSYILSRSAFKTMYNALKLSIGIIVLTNITVVIGTIQNNFLAFENVQYIASHIYGKPLPIDNWLPKFLYDQISNGSIQTPFTGDWLSSDRPPLQTALLFFFSPNMLDDTTYLAYSVSLQLLVIVFMFYLFDRVFSSKVLKISLLVLVFFNSMVFINALFVWPKMLSAVYQAISFYFVYLILLEQRKEKISYILFGLSFILAFLSHGGAIFYLIGLGLILAMHAYKKNQISNLFYALATIIIVYIPWMVYQKFIDPPGDRLLKWHLADQIDITEKSFLNILIQKYSTFDIQGYIEHKLSQIKIVFGEMFSKYTNFFDDLGANALVSKSFFHQEYSYLFFSSFFLVLVFFTKIKNEKEKHFFNLLLASYLLYLFFWIFLLLSPTVLHHGSSLAWIVGLLVIFLATYYFNKYLAMVILLCNLCLFYIGYIHPQLKLFSQIDVAKQYVKEDSLLATSFVPNAIHNYKELKDFSVYGSYINGDQDVATIRFLFNLDNSFVYKTGPDSKNQTLNIFDFNGTKLFSEYLQKSETWSIYKLDPQIVADALIIEIQDNGTGWGEWSAVAFQKDNDDD